MSESAELPRTMLALRDGIATGVHVGAQLFISRDDATIADFAIGDARPNVAMTPDTLMIWMSACKPVTAVAIAQLWERGKLDLDDRVIQYIPEFAAGGKEAITIRHLLTHTGGFRGILGEWERQPWDQIIGAVCNTRLEAGWVPGRKAGYHVATSWYILAEIVQRVAARALPDYVHEEIFLPLGMNDSWIGMPAERYRAYGDRIGLMHDTSGQAPTAEFYWDTEPAAVQCRPAGNGRGPIRELGRFYLALLNKGELNGRRILSPQTVEAIVSPHRVGMYDHTFRHVMDWGLGFIVNSARYGRDSVPYGFGPHATEETFGHSGHQSTVAFADRANGLVVALVCNGMPGEVRHHVRMREILTAIYEDLGLAST